MKITALILALTLLIGMLAACGGGGSENMAVTDADTITEVETTTAETALTPDIPDTDLGGKELHFYVMGPKRNAANYSVEIYAESENGDPINDAVYRRNSLMQEKYNFVISETQSTAGTMSADVQSLVLAGDDVYQVTMLNLIDSTPLVKQGMLYDLSDTAYIDLDKPWWDSVMADELSIGNRLYYAMGDINIMDNNATWAVFFNKELINNYGLVSPYDDVSVNKWTIDRLYEYCTAIARDLDGDGVMSDEHDLWAMVGESYNAFMLYIAAGERLTVKDTDDLPVLDPPDSRAVQAVEKIIRVMTDKERVINAHDYASKYASVFNDLIRGNFKKDQALFYIAGLLTFTLLRDMESAYGMVPMPKLDESQSEYYTSLNYSNLSTVNIPITNPDPDATSLILEALAYGSADTLTPAYYETALERKYMRDEESREMLEIILDTRVYDLMSLYNWGGIYGIFGNMVTSASTDFASKYAALQTAAETAIAATLEDMKLG
ncbi:MAG: extracellular solute-binding protein [Clostridiales bacterium]|nr:extracellular solute-binding protein [Clostridiales bacterium]